MLSGVCTESACTAVWRNLRAWLKPFLTVASYREGKEGRRLHTDIGNKTYRGGMAPHDPCLQAEFVDSDQLYQGSKRGWVQLFNSEHSGP